MVPRSLEQGRVSLEVDELMEEAGASGMEAGSSGTEAGPSGTEAGPSGKGAELAMDATPSCMDEEADVEGLGKRKHSPESNQR